MKKTLLGAAIALLSSSVVYAQDYQFEVSADYINGERFDVDYDGYGLNAQIHLDKVDTSKGPLNEAAFLDKSSFVNLGWATAKADVSGADSVDVTAVDGRFVTGSNIIIEANYLDLDADTSYGVGVGTYISETMDVVASYQTFDKADQSAFAVALHGLNPLKGEASVAFDAGLAYIDSDGDAAYSFNAGADYYLNNALSIGAGAEFVSYDNADTSAVNLRANYFVTPIVRLGAALETLGQDDDGQNVQLNAAVRF